MRSILTAIACVLSLMIVNSSAFAAAGDSDLVKGWYAPSFESIKEATQPMIVYIYDAKPKLNHFAEKLESKVFLNNADVAAKVSKFRCIKIKSDSKDWPAEWTSGATNGAVLLVMSSDRHHIETFDKNDSSRLTSAMLVSAMDAILAAEPKEPRKVAEKPVKKEVEEPPKNAGLGIKGIGDNGGDKEKEKNVTSKPETKKPNVVDE